MSASVFLPSPHTLSMNPEIDMGQAQGAFVMGLGYYLLEETRYDDDTGRNMTASTWVSFTVDQPNRSSQCYWLDHIVLL